VYRVHASGGDVVFAASQFVVLALFGVAVPVGLNSMLNLMAADIARSDRDALTGLLNRRGFHRRTRHLIDSQADRGGGELTIAMLDLDRFKQLNDRRGHAAGDEALIDVARVLREVTHPTAVVARVGGEEFLVAEAPSPGEAPLSARLCQAVAESSHDITASVGSSSVPMSWLDHQNRALVIDHLIAVADAAMYSAKTDGGNQHRHLAGLVDQ
jgi:diguanylate cyclase (GGDEF)-like protein